METELLDSALRLLEDCDHLSDAEAKQFIDHASSGDPRLRALAVDLMPSYRAPIAEPSESSVRVQIDAVVGGRYAVRRIISANDDREILVAEDRAFGDLVVLKGVVGLARIEALVREARILRALNHTSIPRALDFVVAGRSAYLAMDFVDGVDLETELCRRLSDGRGPFAERDVVAWSESVLEALEYLHSLPCPVVHRDLKPMNLVRRLDGSVAILDFGVSKRFDGFGDDDRTAQPTMRGFTPGYAPMEQLVEGAPTDARTDLYALGATMYRLLTGRGLVPSADRYLAVTTGAPDPLPRLDRIGASVSPGVAAVVTLALSPKTDDRPPSASAMRAALRTAQTRSAQRARRARVAAALISFLVLGSIAAWYVAAASSDARSQSTQPTGPARPISPDPAFETAIGLSFVEIPSATFDMGMYGAWGNESPMHRVTISRRFQMGTCEITQAQWRAVMGTDPSAFHGDDLPVETVSWEDAKEFCGQLGMRTGHVYRLPTEAEWEHACGVMPGGPMDQLYDDLSGWYNVNAQGMTHPVGQKPPNRYGLHDMHGNVWEWCEDWFAFYPSDATTDPTGPATGQLKVFRGGAWSLGVAAARVTNRAYNSPSGRGMDVGFRIVKIR